MIDTISLQLSDLKKHEVLVNQLRIHHSGFRKFDAKGKLLNHEFLLPEVSMRGKEKITFRVLNTASSHYKIICVVDHHKDCVTFSFSIPKYFYGHNIAQAVQNPNEPKFNFTMKEWEDIASLGFERLWSYVLTFFDEQFPTVQIDYTQLKLKRLDLCYNQVFRSKHDALEYLELQKSVKKKHLRETNQMAEQMYQVYSSSIFYSNQDYSVKIYHKGTEYQKNDKVQHELINHQKKQTIFQTEYLQEFSDKILRYEITIRPSYMSYLYNTKVFRKNSKQFQTWKAIFNKIKNVYTRANNKKFFESYDMNANLALLLPFVRSKVDKQTEYNFIELMNWIFNKKEKGKKISDEYAVSLMKRFYREFETLVHTRRNFYFKLDHTQKKLAVQDNVNNSNHFKSLENVELNKEMYLLMTEKLKDFIVDMRIDAKKPISHYLDKIDEHNAKMDRVRKMTKGVPAYAKGKTRKYDKAHFGMLLMVLQNSTMENLCKMTGISARTKYKYIADLKAIGYTKNTLDNLHIQVPELNFNAYYSELMTNQYKFFTNQLFILKHRK